MSMQGQKGNLSGRDRKALGGAQANGAGRSKVQTENPADPSLVGRNTRKGGSTGATKATVTTVTPGEYGGRPKTFGRAGNTHLAN